MTFIIRTPEDKLRAIDAIRDAPFKPVQKVDVSDYRKNRTAAQGRFFHKLRDLINEVTGEGEFLTKFRLIGAVFTPELVKVKYRTPDGIEDRYIPIVKSTAEMTVEELSMIIDEALRVAHFLEIKPPYDDEYLDSMKGK